ncbi:helix-turn-helix domain-containing protein [Streptomyces sp. NPDC005533]|uniref:helix-turn-helix domain-containing protein n=1 Tax=Streptomyces sp. NPDC005533 TaxID=3364723 RepID=UPI0036B744F1
MPAWRLSWPCAGTFPRLSDAWSAQVAAQEFGCARAAYNDALRTREDARKAGLPFVTSAGLSRRSQPRRRLRAGMARGGVVGGTPAVSPGPGHRIQVLRRPEGGKLRLRRTGDVRVKWSRALPSVPSTVTGVKDSAGFASFVVGRNISPGRARGRHRPGTAHFAILAVGRKNGNPRFLRRGGMKLKKAQRDLSRKVKRAAHRARARLKVARAHVRYPRPRAWHPIQLVLLPSPPDRFWLLSLGRRGRRIPRPMEVYDSSPGQEAVLSVNQHCQRPGPAFPLPELLSPDRPRMKEAHLWNVTINLRQTRVTSYRQGRISIQENTVHSSR